jgi:transcriptional regulator with XRE-family HTH domain
MAPTKDTDAAVRARIRAWLRYYLERRDWSQKKLAAKIGIGASTLNQIVNGTRTAGFDVAIKMHRAFDRSLDDFIDDDPPAIPKEDT